MDPVGAVGEGFLGGNFVKSCALLASKLSAVEVSDSLLGWVLGVTGYV